MAAKNKKLNSTNMGPTVGIQPVKEKTGPTVGIQPVKEKTGPTVGIQPVDDVQPPVSEQPGTDPNLSYLISLPGLSDSTKQSLGNLINTGYQPSQAVTEALTELNGIISNQPAQFQSQYFDQLNNVMNQILGRESFSYDLASDPMYQQYRDQYMQSGRQAMQDTMGQAATLTGGYGSSYASTAGNQAYQQHLNRLNEMAPELYQMALQQYQMEGDQLQQQYTMLNDMYQNEYGQYQDQYDRWAAARDYYSRRYESERDYGYNDYRNSIGDWKDVADWERSQYNADRDFEYNKQLDERDFEYNKQLDEYNKQLDERDFEYNKQLDERDFEYNKQLDERDFEYNKQLDEYNKQNAEREYYFNYAMQMIQAGKKPSQDLLDRLGLSEDDIKKLQKYYKNQNKTSGSSSSSSGSKKRSNSSSDASSTAPTANSGIPEGMTPEEYADYLVWLERMDRGGYNGNVPTTR